MLDRKLILELNKNGHSQAHIARIMGVSRQRINQILIGYVSPSSFLKYKPKNGRYKNSTANVIQNIKKENCAICRGKSTAIHHIDRNSRNNVPSNLLPVCVKCHKELHLSEFTQKLIKYNPGIKTWSRNHSECNMCGTRKEKYHALGLCKRCYGIYTYHVRKKQNNELY